MGIILTAAGLPLLTSTGRTVSAAPNAVTVGTPVAVSPSSTSLAGASGWVYDAYENEPLTLDFAGALTGTITGITPSVPHSVNGTTLTIVPIAATPKATTTYTVTDSNGGSRQIEMMVPAAPATIAASGTPQALTVEVNRAVPRTNWRLYFTGGVAPYTYEDVSVPSWMLTRSGSTYAVAAPASPGNHTATVRVTDRRGNSVVLTVSITVIAARNRNAPGVMLASDASVSAAITRLGLGAGGVLRIPSGIGVKALGSAVNIANGHTNPLIIMGDVRVAKNNNETVLAPHLTGWSGVMFENITFRETDTAGGYIVRGGNDVTFYRCRAEGFRSTVNPNDGQAWQNSLTYTFTGYGWRIEGLRCVAQECVAFETREGWNLGDGLIVDGRVEAFQDDGIVIQAANGGVIDGFVLDQPPAGNYLLSHHRDLVQGFSDNSPIPSHICIRRMFASSEGAEGYLQGYLTTHGYISWNNRNTWTETDRTVSRTWQHMVVEESVILSGHQIGIGFARWGPGSKIDKCVVIMHPGEPWGARGTFYTQITHYEPSQVRISNSIFPSIAGSAQTSFGHLIQQVNNRLLPATNRPAYAAVFPNFENTGLASINRVQIAPAWAAANPGVGPAMLGGAP